MKKLEKIIKCNGSVHTQLDRSKKCAIYEAGRNDYEVFIIKVAKEGEIFEKNYPEREIYPSNEDFGKTAWYFMSYENAINRFNQIKKVHG